MDPWDIGKWRRLGMMAKAILRPKAKALGNNTAEYVKEVKGRCKRWRDSPGAAQELWDEAVHAHLSRGVTKGRRRNKRPEMNSSEMRDKTNAVRASSLLQEGQYTRAAQALTSQGIDQESEGAWRAMVAKHPSKEPPSLPTQSNNTSPLQVSLKQVREAIQSFRPGTAPGPSGLRPQHLKEAKEAKATQGAMSAVAAVRDLINTCI